MTIFYLVRHGQIVRGQANVDPADPPLAEEGVAEAARVAAYLQPHPIAHIYASPLRRAQETAAVIAARWQLPVITEPRLRERMNFGDEAGQSFAEFAALWARVSHDRDYVPPVGDSSRGAGARVEAWMAAVHATLPTGEVVAVAHGGLIADFLLNVGTPAELAQLSPTFVAQPYAGEVMRNGSITVVEYTGHYHVKAVALTSHL